MESKLNFDEIFADEDEADEIIGRGGTSEDNEFDRIVGALEEILVDETSGFSSLQSAFCDKHCDVFDDTEENKVVYTQIFNEYTEIIEATLDEKLRAKVLGFSMKKFETMLVSRQNEIVGEIFDLLLSLGDFNEFKDMMLSHKMAKKPSSKGVFDAAAALSIGGTGLSIGGTGLSIGGLSIQGTKTKSTAVKR